MNQHSPGPYTVEEPIDPLSVYSIRGPVNYAGYAPYIAAVIKTGFPAKGWLYPSIAGTAGERRQADEVTAANAALLASAADLLDQVLAMTKYGWLYYNVNGSSYFYEPETGKNYDVEHGDRPGWTDECRLRIAELEFRLGYTHLEVPADIGARGEPFVDIAYLPHKKEAGQKFYWQVFFRPDGTMVHYQSLARSPAEIAEFAARKNVRPIITPPITELV